MYTAGRGIILARRQGVPLHHAGGHIENEHPGAQALPTRRVFARGEDQPPWGFGWSEGAVRTHALPAAAIALGPHQAIRFPVLPGDVGFGAGGTEIIHHQHSIFGLKGNALQGIARRTPGGR